MINFVMILKKQNPSFMMIRKIALAMILSVVTTVSGLYGQLSIDIGEHSGNAGQTVDVPLIINGFDQITTMEFWLAYDPNVMTFNSIVSTADIENFNASVIGTPPGLAEGNISFSFDDFNGSDPEPDGTELVVFRFNLVGDECDETSIGFNQNQNLFYSDLGFQIIPLTGMSGTVSINGTDCNGGGGGATDLTSTAATTSGAPGTQICVPITVQNFKSVVDGFGVGSGQGDICWNPNVITYTGIENNQLPAQFSLNTNGIATGTLKFVWFNANPTDEVILPDGSTLFEICFDAVGSIGEMSTIDLKDWEWADNSDNIDIPDTEIDGKVTIANAPEEQFELIVSQETVEMGDEVCVDISTNNFTNIVALEHRILWNSTVLSFGSLEDDVRDRTLGQTNNEMSYNASDNFFTLSWTSTSPRTYPDGTSLYKVCFDAIGDCESSSTVSVEPNNGSSIIVGTEVNGMSVPIPASSISLTSGNVDVTCPTQCSVINTQGSCENAQSGSITVNVPAGSNCTWTNAAGQVVGNDCNLFGVAPGTYTLSVSGAGGECTLTETIDEMSGPMISGSTTDEGCTLGQINATIQNFVSYTWDDVTIGQNLNPQVSAGNYMLTANASNGCQSDMTFTVGFNIPTLTSNFITTDPSCGNLSDGSIDLNISGGCAPYMVEWSDGGSGEIRTDFGNGTYTATITDDNNEQLTVNGITLNTPEITLVGNPLIMDSAGSDGSISITVNGGVGQLSYSWTPSAANSNTISGLAPGDYTVVVTDDNGCTETFGPFSVLDTGIESVNLTFEDAGDGFGVVCNGDNTATISASVISTNLPGMITLTGEGVNMTVDVTSAATVTFENLSAGEYTAEFINSIGESFSSTITVTEPEAIEVESEIGCENNDQADGFIDITISGGVGELDLNWNIPGTEGQTSLDNLTQGSYMVAITDENGCQLFEPFNVFECGNEACYLFPKIITPNNDGQNDVFFASCLNNVPATLTVFDRWGRMVFSMNSYDGSWSGVESNGDELIEGGYMWVLDIDFGSGERRIEKGTVTILRD